MDGEFIRFLQRLQHQLETSTNIVKQKLDEHFEMGASSDFHSIEPASTLRATPEMGAVGLVKPLTVPNVAESDKTDTTIAEVLRDTQNARIPSQPPLLLDSNEKCELARRQDHECVRSQDRASVDPDIFLNREIQKLKTFVSPPDPPPYRIFNLQRDGAILSDLPSRLKKVLQIFNYRVDRLRFIDSSNSMWRVEHTPDLKTFQLSRGQCHYEPPLVRVETEYADQTSGLVSPPSKRNVVRAASLFPTKDASEIEYPLQVTWKWLSMDDVRPPGCCKYYMQRLWFYYRGVLNNESLRASSIRISSLVEVLQQRVLCLRIDYRRLDSDSQDLAEKELTRKLEALDAKGMRILISLDALMNANVREGKGFIKTDDFMRMALAPYDSVCQQYVDFRDRVLTLEDEDEQRHNRLVLLARSVNYLRILCEYTRQAIDRNDAILFQLVLICLNIVTVITQFFYDKEWKQQLASLYNVLVCNAVEQC